jgi:hypothetical protein
VVMMKGDDAVRWGIHRLVQTQLVAFVIGGVLGLVISWRFRPRASTPEALPASSKTPTAPPAAGPGDRTTTPAR